MMIIYHAANSLDAHMIKGLLAQYEIPAYIQGEFLQGGAGELQAAFNVVTVSVDNINQPKAKKIIDEWDSGAIVEGEQEPTNLVGGGLNATS